MAKWWHAKGFYHNLCLYKKIYIIGDRIVLESDNGTENIYYDSPQEALAEYVKLMDKLDGS